MRLNATALGLVLLSAPMLALASPASAAKPTAQSSHCAQLADKEGLTGAKRSAYVASCIKGPLAPKTPTAATGTSKEAHAVTKPSGVDRTTRSKQCATEADKKGLTAKERSAFQLSCLATAGPVTEGETGTKSPRPANAIKGIGVNNNTPGATPAKSVPK